MQPKLPELGLFKIRLLALEDSIEHTLTHESVCSLINEAKRDWVDIVKEHENDYTYDAELVEIQKDAWFKKWFGDVHATETS